jgi:hypothetical protein
MRMPDALRTAHAALAWVAAVGVLLALAAVSGRIRQHAVRRATWFATLP